MMITKTATNDPVHRYQRCLVVPFEGKRKVMSTSMHNGGYREDLSAVFNHDVNPGPGRLCEYCNSNQNDIVKSFIENDLGLDYEHVAYMQTIVSMENASIQSDTYDILSVTAIATASLEVNGGRVGEAATSYEKNGSSINLQPGTINIMVFVNADMTPGSMARAMMTATEAKTAAIQELMGGSLNSHGIATGSGTDNLMIIANSESSNLLTYAGKHGKLGELIGRLVMQAVKESLGKHMNLTIQSQHNMFSRIKRYGADEHKFIQTLKQFEPLDIHLSDAIHNLHVISQREDIVVLTSFYIHLLDQWEWGLIANGEVEMAGEKILMEICEIFKVDFNLSRSSSFVSKEKFTDSMIEKFVSILCKCSIEENKKNNG